MTGRRSLAVLLALFGLPLLPSSPLWAMSELQRGAMSAAAQSQPGQDAPPSDGDSTSPSEGEGVPQPPPLHASPSDNGADDDQSEPEQVQPANPDSSDVTRPQIDPKAPPPEVLYDLGKLPEPARHMHDALLAACKSGDIEQLRPLLTTGNEATQLSLGEVDTDPIEFLHQLSGDAGGQEILAIMEEILDAGFVHLDAGKPDEVYVWPYFVAIPLARLNAPQRVELYRIITAGDYEDMKSIGAYIFYRVGITPQGKWAFFLAGD